MEEKSKWFDSKAVFFIILLFFGFVEGILLFRLNLDLQAFWAPYIKFNPFFEGVSLVQEIILFFLIFLGFGYLIFRIKGSFATNTGNEKKVSAIMGVIAGMVYVIVTDYYVATTNLIGSQYYQKYLVPNDPYSLKFYVSFLLSCEIVPFLIVVIFFSIILHVYGAELYRYASETDNKNCSYLPIILFSGGIVFILLLTGLSSMAVTTGIIEHEYGCPGCHYWDLVSVEKTGVDSVAITLLTEDPSTAWILSDKRPVFDIFLNGINVSTAASIQNQGIALTLDPPGGLKYQKGSRLILKGPAVFQNTSFCNITVIEKFPEYSRVIIYENVSNTVQP